MIDFEYKIPHDPANILQDYQQLMVLIMMGMYGLTATAALHILVTAALQSADLSNVIVGGAACESTETPNWILFSLQCDGWLCIKCYHQHYPVTLVYISIISRE